MVKPGNLMTQTSVGGVDMSALRRSARENSPEGLKAVAQQFEALLMNMMLKSMREATPKGGLFDNDQTRLYTSLLDQQISQNFAKRGMGLADALVKQMTLNQSNVLLPEKVPPQKGVDGIQQSLLDTVRLRQAELATSLLPEKLSDAKDADGLAALIESLSAQSRLSSAVQSGAVLSDSATRSSATIDARPAHVRAFQDRLADHADEASRETGIPAKFMLGQAALESGWGRKVMHAPDGTSSHNLFGIKATKGWTGKVVEATTTEYVNGVAYRQKEKFRAYDSYADSFKDYARFLKSNPRYQNVLANSHDAASFAQGLQRAGYATDPHYAVKLTNIIQKSLSA